jgi:hypothetical protein
MNLDVLRLRGGLVNRCQPSMTACKPIVTGVIGRTRPGKSGVVPRRAACRHGVSRSVRRSGASSEGNCTRSGAACCPKVLRGAGF